MKKIYIYLLLMFTLDVYVVKAQHNESNIIINEILYNPIGTDTIEFIELLNISQIPINLTGYKMTSPFNYNFPNVVIQANSYYVVANDSARMKRLFGINTGQWGASNSLANTNKLISIIDAQSNLVDSVHYYNTAPWPAISSSAGGPSIELNNPLSDNNNGKNWKYSSLTYITLNNGQLLYCSPGSPNIPFIPEADFSCSSRILTPNTTIKLLNKSFGDNLNYQWTLQGGSPSYSTEENPDVTYSNYGIFDVSLKAQNSTYSNTKGKENYIGVLKTECVPIFSFPYVENFSNNIDCWILQSTIGKGGWEQCNTMGYDDNSSLKFDCANNDDDCVAKIICPKINLINTSARLFCIYYYASLNLANPAAVSILELDENLEELLSHQISFINLKWTKYEFALNNKTSYIVVTTQNKPGNNFVYLDKFSISEIESDTHVISGKISDIFDKAVENILIVADNNNFTHSNTDGTYQITVNSSWSGMVSAKNPQYIYQPEYHHFFNIKKDTANINFRADILPSGWVFSKTNDSHSFCILESAFSNNNFLPFASWIGVFYVDGNNNEKCCGAIQFTENNTYCLNAWSANSTMGDEGYIEGGKIIWKVFDNQTSKTYNAIVNYTSGPQIFTNDGVSIIGSITIDIDSQILIIPDGWSGISSYIIPESYSLNEIFKENKNNIIALSNENGIYFPNNPNSTLTNWNTETGWLIKCINPIIQTILGNNNNNLVVNFPVGWTLFPVKSKEAISASTLFADVLPYLDIVKGYGNNEIFIPNVNSDFIIIPGKAYKARFNTASSVTFSFGGKNTIAYEPSLPIKSKAVSMTSIDHVFIFKDAENLHIDDEIIAFTPSGLCVGNGIVKDNKTAVFKAFGNDFTTENIDGLIENEHITFKLLRADTLHSLNISFAPNTQNYDYFVNDGISYINRVKIIYNSINTANDNFYIFPNPADKLIRIFLPYINPNSEIVINDMNGKTIQTIKATNSNIQIISIDKLPTGTYIVKYEKQTAKFIKE